MSVTVIIPTHNRFHIIRQTIYSYLQNQTVSEILIINDGSTDATGDWLCEISQKEPRIKSINIESNIGAPEARNIGIKNASKETNYFFWGEDDVFLEKGAIDKLVNILNKENADLIGGRFVSFSELNSSAELDTPVVNKAPVNLSLMRVNFKINTGKNVTVPFLHACYLARKQIFDEVQYDSRYYANAFREETDVCLEAVKKGAKIFYTPFVKICHVEAPSGGQRRISKWNYEKAILKNNWYFLNKHHQFLKEKYHINTPKWFYQAVLLIRYIYLLIIIFGER